MPLERSEGLARELVRRLQELRRRAGFEVSDRIHVTFTGDDGVRAAFDEHGGYISDETLARTMTEQTPLADATSIEVTLDGHDLTLGVQRAGS